MLATNRTLSIFKSRTVLLSQLAALGYNTDDYEQFSINEIDAMFVNNQLDMILSSKQPQNQQKVYIHYFMNLQNITKSSKQMKADYLDKMLEDLMEDGDAPLKKTDTLIVVMEEEPNESITNRIKYLYEHNKVFVVIHNIRRLLFDMTEHVLVPKTTVVPSEKIENLIKQYHLNSVLELPEISRFDPLALVMLLRPGQVCACERKSQTALHHTFYRVCV